MSYFPEMGGRARFAPAPNDSIRELRWKAESMLEYLRDQEAFLRQFPTGAIEERLELWTSLADLLARAMSDDDLETDARLEANRVWAEELHHSAMFVMTMSVYARSEAAERCFKDDPESLDQLITKFEQLRPAAFALLSTKDLKYLRDEGFLREGE